MCRVLRDDLWCHIEDAALKDGLVHFCLHVEREQELELAVMQGWLRAKGKPAATAKCGGGAKGASSSMSMGCGRTESEAAKLFMQVRVAVHPLAVLTCTRAWPVSTPSPTFAVQAVCSRVTAARNRVITGVQTLCSRVTAS